MKGGDGGGVTGERRGDLEGSKGRGEAEEGSRLRAGTHLHLVLGGLLLIWMGIAGAGVQKGFPSRSPQDSHKDRSASCCLGVFTVLTQYAAEKGQEVAGF